MDNPSAHPREAVSVQPVVPSDHWFRDLAEESGDLFFVIRTHPDLAVEFMSDTIETHLGFTAHDMMAEPGLMASRLDPRDADKLARILASPPRQFRDARAALDPSRWSTTVVAELGPIAPSQRRHRRSRGHVARHHRGA